MLKVCGRKIVDESGDEVVLKGYNIGNFLAFENFMFGFAGVEQQFRADVSKYAGKEKADYFFDKYLTAFFGEDDVRFLKELGCNCLRIPFSYRHFERDDSPYFYDEAGFFHLDRIVELCRRYGMYIILDLHCAQGCQSPDWHCDNLTGEVRLYKDAACQNRLVKLWSHIAGHYSGERVIAGYDIINEPDAKTAPEIAALNRLDREITEGVRKVDPDHIVFISGNNFGKRFDVLDPPFTDNLAYTFHYYPDAATSAELRYPGNFGNFYCDRRMVELQMDVLDEFMRRYGVPCWVGEFGVRLSYKNYIPDRLRIFDDQLKTIDGRGHSWSLWTYKDLCHIGTVNCRPDSPWVDFISDIIDLKRKYNCDMNFRFRDTVDLTPLIGSRYDTDFPDDYAEIADDLRRGIKCIYAKHLSDRLGRKFAALTYDDLDRLVSSFEFKNCVVDERRLASVRDCLGTKKN